MTIEAGPGAKPALDVIIEQLTALEERAQQRDAVIQEAQEEVRKAQEKVQKAQEEVRNIQDELERQEQEKNDLQTQRDDLATQVQSKEQEIQRLHDENIRLAAANAAGAGAGAAGGAGVPPPAGGGSPEAPEDEIDRLLREDAEEQNRQASEGARRQEAERQQRRRAASMPTDDGGWARVKSGFSKTGDAIGRALKDGMFFKAGEYLEEHIAAKVALTFLTKVTGTAILTTTFWQYSYERGMVAAEKDIVLEALSNLRREALGLDEQGNATREKWNDGQITQKVTELLTTIDGLKWVPSEWRVGMKLRIKQLIEDAQKEYGWEEERYGRECYTLVDKYITTKMTSVEITGDFLAPQLIAAKMLMYRGISSAALSLISRRVKEQRNYERAHQSIQEEAAKATAWQKMGAVKKALGLFKQEAYWHGAAVVGGGREWFEDFGFIGSKEEKNWRHKVRAAFMALRFFAIARAALHVPETNFSKLMDDALREWQERGVLATFRDNALFTLEQTPGLGQFVRPFIQNISWGNYDYIDGHVVDRVVAASPQAAFAPPPPEPEPVPPVEATPPIGFFLNKIHGLGHVGIVNKGTYMKIFVDMYTYRGMDIEFKFMPYTYPDGRTVTLPYLTAVNGHGINHVAIDSQGKLDSVLDNPVDPFKSIHAPVEGTESMTMTMGGDMHRVFEAKDDSGVAYELKATTIYQDSQTKGFYELRDGQSVHNQDDILQSDIRKYGLDGIRQKFEIVGVRGPDGVLHPIDPLPLNDPVHGKYNCTEAFQKIHARVLGGLQQRQSIEDILGARVRRSALPIDSSVLSSSGVVAGSVLAASAGARQEDRKSELVHDPSIGHYSATSSGRLAQKILGKDFQSDHNLPPKRLSALKGNLRVLLEGMNIARHGQLVVGQDEFKAAMGVVNPDHKQWGAEIRNEQRWNAVVGKLLKPPSIEPASAITREAPRNLPVESVALMENWHHPDVDAAQAVLSNPDLSADEKFNTITKLLEPREREQFSIPVGGGRDIVFTKLHRGPGIFVRLPGEPYAKNFFSPKTVGMIEKLLLNRHD